MKALLFFVSYFVFSAFVNSSTFSSTTETIQSSTIVSSETTPTPVTTIAPCVDNPNTNCANMKPYCNNPEYRDLLGKECPVTCNFCGTGNCYDLTDKCTDWKANGFCENPFYKDDAGKYCKKTCDLC